MDPTQIVTNVVAWVNDVLPELAGDYAYVPEGKTKALPDVVADVGGIRTAINDPAFPFSRMQQRYIVVYGISLSIMVDNSNPESAADTLRDFAARLGTSLLTTGGTLGGRVQMVSPFFTFDFSRPFVRYPDGTKGREVIMDMSVGELVEVQT